jgi:hypothetical protein
VAEDYIRDIRQLLTDIKPLLAEATEEGSPASVATFSAEQSLASVRSQLRYVLENLRRWQPGPTETK